jgi:peptidoglycan/xylan/chitin deacetylase (PgdA/CDA1 family)
VDYGQIVRSRILSLLTSEEIKTLDALGIDVQLHTHRHRLPNDEAQVRREIEDNRKSLKEVIREPLAHLCYPSGIWNPSQFRWLEAEGIVSATTCQDGFNTAATNRLALHRFLDEDGLSSIEFEKKLCGFQELLRIVTGRGRHSAR